MVDVMVLGMGVTTVTTMRFKLVFTAHVQLTESIVLGNVGCSEVHASRQNVLPAVISAVVEAQETCLEKVGFEMGLQGGIRLHPVSVHGGQGLFTHRQ